MIRFDDHSTCRQSRNCQFDGKVQVRHGTAEGHLGGHDHGHMDGLLNDVGRGDVNQNDVRYPGDAVEEVIEEVSAYALEDFSIKIADVKDMLSVKVDVDMIVVD